MAAAGLRDPTDSSLLSMVSSKITLDHLSYATSLLPHTPFASLPTTTVPIIDPDSCGLLTAQVLLFMPECSSSMRNLILSLECHLTSYWLDGLVPTHSSKLLPTPGPACFAYSTLHLYPEYSKIQPSTGPPGLVPSYNMCLSLTNSDMSYRSLEGV